MTIDELIFELKQWVRENQETDYICGLNTNSKGYALVVEALHIAINDSMDAAKSYLMTAFEKNKLVKWECAAIASCFSSVMSGSNNVRRAQ